MRYLSILLLLFMTGNCGINSAVSGYEPQIVISPTIAWQGKVMSVALQAEDIALAEMQFLGQKITCFPDGTASKGIVGVPVEQKPGLYDLEIFIVKKDGRVEKMIQQVKVQASKFPYSKYHLPPSKDKLRARDIIDNEWARIEEVLMNEEPSRFWQGKFSLPAGGRISQGFGFKTIVNGKISGTHRGVDIATYEGQSVLAPNRGRVALAENFQAFGGTMVLDHGQGIHSLYFHLSKFAAEVGAMVEQSQLIALSGNSGISSGPHLHWGLSAHNLRVDPLQWTKHEF